MTKNIALICLKNTNIGDSIIFETTKFLIENLGFNFNIKPINLFPPKSFNKLVKIKNSLKTPNIIQKIKHFLYKNNNNYKNYYKNQLKNVDCVIFVGGGIIKYTREFFFYPIYSITNYCKENNIPMYFNAIGVEGYDESNASSIFLKKALNNECIKYISTRDDIKNLRKYVNDESKTFIVGDSALWSKETYKNIEKKDTNIIGIGVIRGDIYTDYEIKYSSTELLNTYINIIKELENRNYKWQLFCNGNKNDYKFGLKILEKLGIKDISTYLVKQPTTGRELAQIITNYKAIIAARMHANIVATSYNVPSIGLVWNDKLKMFGKMINCPERYIEKEDFSNPKLIIDKFETAIKEGYLPASENIKDLKNKTKENLYKFLEDVLHPVGGGVKRSTILNISYLYPQKKVA